MLVHVRLYMYNVPAGESIRAGAEMLAAFHPGSSDWLGLAQCRFHIASISVMPSLFVPQWVGSTPEAAEV